MKAEIRHGLRYMKGRAPNAIEAALPLARQHAEADLRQTLGMTKADKTKYLNEARHELGRG